jgi:alkaline phosphatase D
MPRLAPLQIGPVIGHTTHDFATLWARAEPGLRVHGRVQRKDGWEPIPFRPSTATTDWCTVAVVTFNGAESLAFQVGLGPEAGFPGDGDWGQASAGSVRRAKIAGDPTAFSFLLGSCRQKGYWLDPQGDTAMGAIHELQGKGAPDDFMIMAGDQVYCDHPVIPTGFFGAILRSLLGSPPIKPEEFFERYHTYFTLPSFRQVTSELPSYMIFDDHDLRDNWGRYRFGPEGKWPLWELEAGLHAYDAYQGLHAPLDRDANGRPRRWWYSFRWGMAEFFVLDTRGEREDPEGAATMLGPQQMAALRRFIVAPVKDRPSYRFVVSSVPFAPDTQAREVKGADTWRAYPEQRREILELMRTEAPLLPIFLSGDLHIARYAEIRHKADSGFVVPCVMTGALNWFVFGTQPKPWFPGFPGKFALEDGTLPETPGELASPPASRTGLYYCPPSDDYYTRNCFTRIEVSKAAVQVVLYSSHGEQVGKPVTIPQSSLARGA